MSTVGTPAGPPVPVALQIVGSWGWRILVGAGVFYIALSVLTQVLVVVVPLVIALFLAAVFEPVVTRLERLHVPRLLGAATVVLSLVGGVISLGYWLSSALGQQFDELSDQLRAALDQIEDWLADGPLGLSEDQIAGLQDQLVAVVSDAPGGWAGPARTVFEILAGTLLVVFILFFVLKDGPKLGAWIFDRLPRERRTDAIVTATRAGQVMRQYLAASAITGLIDGALIALALWIIGVPLILPLAVITVFAAFFPLVGATVAGGLAALTVTTGLVLGGIIGGFLAVPTVAALAQVLHFYRVRPDELAVANDESGEASVDAEPG